MDGNPFKPTAGKMPPVLVGRQLIIEDFREALRDGIGAPGRIMLVTGQRGFGKTVMLTEFRKIAKSEGWLTISETASDGLVDRLALALDPQDVCVWLEPNYPRRYQREDWDRSRWAASLCLMRWPR